MNCNKVNEISIVCFLQSRGFEPVRTSGNDVWYLSPIRNENTPSFKVNVHLNRWYDHGLGQGGKLIDLGIRLLGVSVKEFLSSMDQTEVGERIINRHQKLTKTIVSLEKIKELQHSALLKYLILRSITLPVARIYCSEVHYSVNGKSFFGIGFKNDSGGMEIRNPYFKGCIGTKGIASITRDTSSFSLFEGVFDFLSATQIGLVSDSESIIVLNSVNQLSDAIKLLDNYSPSYIRGFFDNDLAGRSCFSSLKQKFPIADDQSPFYSNYKDLNEMISSNN